MGQFKAQHGLDGFLCQIADLIEFSGCNQIFFHHPASAAGQDLIEGQVGIDVLCVDAAGGHEFHLCIGSGHGLDHVDAAGLFSREELHHIKTERDGHFHIAGIGGAGCYRDPLIDTVFYYCGVQTGAYDEFCSGVHCAVHLLGGEDCACAH